MISPARMAPMTGSMGEQASAPLWALPELGGGLPSRRGAGSGRWTGHGDLDLIGPKFAVGTYRRATCTLARHSAMAVGEGR